MKKFDGILFVTDLDGTLLRDDKTISKKNLEAIEYFKSEGGIFTFITGRIAAGAKIVNDIIKANAPCGCVNGGGIYDYRTEKLLWSVNISRDVLELVEYIDKEVPGMGIEINLHDKIYFCKKNTATEKHRKNENLDEYISHYNDVMEPFAKILFVDLDQDNMNKTIELLHKHPKACNFDFIRSDAMFYEVLPKGASKGNLVLKLAEILGISNEKIISIGDNDNDASMLEKAKLGIAVSNASEKAKQAADYITVSNEEDAIAQIIYDLDNGIINI